jgi:hypothetical protein
MLRIILSSVACPTAQCITTLSHKRIIFGKIKMNKMCSDILDKFFLFKTFLIRRKIQEDIVKNVH